MPAVIEQIETLLVDGVIGLAEQANIKTTQANPTDQIEKAKVDDYKVEPSYKIIEVINITDVENVPEPNIE